jgi:small subunit ribosomal protein S1
MDQPMHDSEQEVGSPAQDENFAELLEQSVIAPDRFAPGDQIEALVSKIGPEWSFIDLGGKSDGVIDTKELMDESGGFTVREGERITAYFLTSSGGEQRFSIRLGAGPDGKAHLEEAFRSGIPIEGAVAGEIKGGFEVHIAGNVRAFCPYSQMGLRRVDNPAGYVGQRLSFRITEFQNKGRNIVVSNRAVLEVERRRQKEELKAVLREKMLVKGTVSSVRDFGAFVDIGGAEGLIPLSEIGWSREQAADVLAPGQEVEVTVLAIDWEHDRISLSLKAAMPDPWKSAGDLFPEGSTHTGTVVRLAPFGAFVSLAPGIDGLVHISKLGDGKRLNHPGEAVAEGDRLNVTVENIEPAAHRMSLAPAKTAAQIGDAAEEEALKKKYVRQQSAASPDAGALGSLGDSLKAALARKKTAGR